MSADEAEGMGEEGGGGAGDVAADGDDDGAEEVPEEVAAAAARVAKAAKLDSVKDRSAADAAACKAYADHEQFWIVDDDEEEEAGPWTWHHYYEPPSSSSSSSSTTPSSSATAPSGPSAKVAQKQWKLLQRDLPAGIYVAATSARVDLLRVFITGPPGTPYQDAVFIFDVQLPPDFPQQPPLIYYLSHGERINPNLHENGKVCLSILGTWTGKQSCELWNPQTSSVLQVLVSIQGLVLCEMPYFNEAGYDKQLGTDEGAYHARRYNEGALLLSLKAMMTSIKYTSPPFERLTRLHFHTARKRILQRLHKLLELKDSPQALAMMNPAAGGATSSDGGALAAAATTASPQPPPSSSDAGGGGEEEEVVRLPLPAKMARASLIVVRADLWRRRSLPASSTRCHH